MVTTRHDASRSPQQPLPPTTTTEGPRQPTTKTTDKDLDISRKKSMRLRHSLFLALLCTVPPLLSIFRDFTPFHGVPVFPPSGLPTITYLTYTVVHYSLCAACLSPRTQDSCTHYFTLFFPSISSHSACSSTQLAVFSLLSNILGVLVIGLILAFSCLTSSACSSFAPLAAFSLLFNILGVLVNDLMLTLSCLNFSACWRFTPLAALSLLLLVLDSTFQYGPTLHQF